VVVAERLDHVEDAEDQEGPPDEHGRDEDGDVGPDEAHDADADPDQPEDEMQPALPGHPHRADDLEQADRNEEPAGEVDDRIHAGVPVTDDEEPEDDGNDPAHQVPAPHLLELLTDDVTDRDVVLCQYVRHDNLLGE